MPAWTDAAGCTVTGWLGWEVGLGSTKTRYQNHSTCIKLVQCGTYARNLPGYLIHLNTHKNDNDADGGDYLLIIGFIIPFVVPKCTWKISPNATTNVVGSAEEPVTLRLEVLQYDGVRENQWHFPLQDGSERRFETRPWLLESLLRMDAQDRYINIIKYIQIRMYIYKKNIYIYYVILYQQRSTFRICFW